MVSGFLISPYDHDRIFSGLAIEIRIWSKTCAGACGLNRFIISWFIVFSSISGGAHALRGSFKWSTGRRPRRPATLELLGRFRARRLLGIVQVDVEAERAHF